MRWSDLSPRHDLSSIARVISFVLLLLPTAILGLLAAYTGSLPVAVGAGVQGLFAFVFLRAHPVWRPPIGTSVVVLYLIATLCAWVPLRDSTHWAPPLAQGLLLFLGIVLFAVHDLIRTGAEPLRQANKWSRRIVSRRHWPEQLADCRGIPEVAKLRGAIRDEPGPALVLLSDPHPEVQVAALGALEYRPHWRPGEAELVLKVGWESEEAAVRAGAAYALAGVGTAELVAGLSEFLRDPAVEVRRAAAEALMWDADSRWPFARDAVREALADPVLYNEGAMFAGIGRLPAAAVADLITWSAEHPPLAGRAILTLVEHYHADLMAAERPELGTELSAMMLASETSPALRVEIAALLREHQLLTADLLDRLTNLDQPAPIRLFAAELMLQINPGDPDGVDVLRGLARQPNRELSVRVAAVLQNVLGLDMGLPEGDLPQPNSKEAADVTRRVLAWANGSAHDGLRATPGPRPASRHSMHAIGSRHSMQSIPPVAATPRPQSRAMIDESAMLPDQSQLLSSEQSGAFGIGGPTPTRDDLPEESSMFPDSLPRTSQPTTRDDLPEESSMFPTSRPVTSGDSSVFSSEAPMPPTDVSMGESSLFTDHGSMSMEESSMLPHDELPPPPPPQRRPGSSAVM
jgi:hypothetical protein